MEAELANIAKALYSIAIALFFFCSSSFLLPLKAFIKAGGKSEDFID